MPAATSGSVPAAPARSARRPQPRRHPHRRCRQAPWQGGEGLGPTRIQEPRRPVELGTRNIKIALRRLRKFARQGAADELDIDGTIDHTARDAGLLNIQMRPERRNAVKLLILFDIGGSMDAHVKVCEELFSACKTEFKH